MLTSEERRFLERLEALLSRALHENGGGGGPVVLAGDVTGPSAATVISQIIALAGGGIRLVAVDNFGAIGALSPALPLAGDVTGNLLASVVARINGATVPVAGALVTGNVLQVIGASALSYGAVNLAGGVNFVTGVLPEANQADQTMLGDVTGTTGASVVSSIAALAGGGTQLLAVNNAGAIISGGAPTSGGPTFLEVTHALPPTGGGAPISVNFDFDLGAISADAGFYVEVKMIATTKDAAGVPGANVTGIAGLQHAGFYETRAGALQVAASSGGGNFNPFRSATEMIGNEPQACDSSLLSGGLAPMNMSAAAVGGASGVFRVIVSNQSTLNAASGTVYVTVWTKVAP